MAVEAQSAVALRSSGSTTMPDPRRSLMIWVGAWSGVVGVVVYNLALLDEMLLTNRILLAIDTTLLMIWLLVLLLDNPGGQP